MPIIRLLGPLGMPLIFGASLMDGYWYLGRQVDPAMLQKVAGTVQGEWWQQAGLRSLLDLLQAARGAT